MEVSGEECCDGWDIVWGNVSIERKCFCGGTLGIVSVAFGVFCRVWGGVSWNELEKSEPLFNRD